ncbi:MAG: glycosyltransferase family 4 protein, partial [Acidobacteriota bacterium]|nr:glycosyltransferase family 4 protein [Acidobacteriota bacterium]
MKKVAIVVQRCHESIVGGSESLAWQYATLLKDDYDVVVLTTTALDISDWANVLPEGSDTKDGINIRRFPVTIGRTPYWSLLHDRLWAEYPPRVLGKTRIPNPRYLKWSLSFQEEFIRTQGPYSAPLLDFLSQHWSEYQTIIFVTYLYPTTYFGLLQVPRNHALLVPTLHDEPPAYLSAYKHAAHRAQSIIWLTDAERRLGVNLWGELPGDVVSAGIETKPRKPAKLDKRYVLYCGRIDPNKGCRELFDYFIRFKNEFPSELSLVLAGKDDLPVPNHPDIDFRGFVSAEEKYSLMAGACIFIMPSQNESFSIVTMEAMAQETPVLASGGSDVLVDHLTESGAGKIYNDYKSFAAALSEMLADEDELAEMGRQGREYVTSQFNHETIRASLIDLLRLQQDQSTLPGPLTFARALPPNPKVSLSTERSITVRTIDHGYAVEVEQYPLTNMPGESFYARPKTHDSRIFQDVVVLN